MSWWVSLESLRSGWKRETRTPKVNMWPCDPIFQRCQGFNRQLRWTSKLTLRKAQHHRKSREVIILEASLGVIDISNSLWWSIWANFKARRTIHHSQTQWSLAICITGLWRSEISKFLNRGMFLIRLALTEALSQAEIVSIMAKMLYCRLVVSLASLRLSLRIRCSRPLRTNLDSSVNNKWHKPPCPG